MEAYAALRSLFCGGIVFAAMLLASSLTNAQENAASNGPSLSVAATQAQNAVQQPNPNYRFYLATRDLDAVIAKHLPGNAKHGATELDLVVVSAPTQLLPMRSPTREVWGGIAAPFWALLHPTQAWRILLPIPAE